LILVSLTACQSGIGFTSEGIDEDLGVLLVVPNVDDDDRDGVPDWESLGTADDDDDLVTVSLRNKKRATEVRLDPPSGVIRVWYDGEIVLGQGDLDRWTLPERAKGKDTIDVQVEVRTHGELAHLQLVDDARDGRTATLRVIGTPPTVGHHLLPTREVWVVPVDFGNDYNNNGMVATLNRELGNDLNEVDTEMVEADVWVQDEPEFLGMFAPQSDASLVMNSVRSDGYGLDPFPESLLGPDMSSRTWGSFEDATTQDSFGNLEASPPIEGYPLGRVYYGWDGESDDLGPRPEVRELFEEVGAQDPFWLDTSWLCVAHIDEVSSFVPDPEAPRGFRFLFADIELGLEMVNAEPAGRRLDRHERTGFAGHGRATFGDYANDSALAAYNRDLARDHLEPMLEKFVEELGLLDEEILRVPSLFHEELYGTEVCGAIAVIPGTVNLLMVTDETGTGGTAFLPDPFLRAPDESRDDDPLIRWWRENLPATVEPIFVDDWNVYHMAQGEVHCGTNQTRDPALQVAGLEAYVSEVL
jgi:protein-arginine deiminase